jgi:BAH domain
MEFRSKDANYPNGPITAIRINWVYRPRDVLRFTSDTRLVYTTMHSDVCPLTSLRGKCVVKHRSEFNDLEKYRKEQHHFYFSQAHDRFIHRWYEVIPTAQVINVPRNVKKALDERWKFIIVEASKVKELTSAVKSCKRCADYCGR